MLIYSMSVSVDGFIAARDGAFGWTAQTRSCFASTSSRCASPAPILAGQPRVREFGINHLAAQAVELGLVNELRVFRYPDVIGAGTPYLPPVTEEVPADLIETRTFGSRVIYERYRRARDESDAHPARR